LGFNPSTINENKTVSTVSNVALSGKNELILLYEVAIENHNIGIRSNAPNPTNNPAIAGLDGSNAIPTPTNIPIGIKNKIVANPLKK